MKIASRVRRTGSAGIVGMLLGAALVVGSAGGAPAAEPTWSAPVDLSAAGANASTPQVALSADGTKATAIWTRSNGANTIIQAASATISGNTATWSAVTDLSAAGQNATDPQVAITADGATATAIWRRSNGSKFIIQTASAAISGNTADWSGVTDLSADGEDARGPQVAMAADATLATAVWARYSGGDEIIQSASATISGKNASWSAATNLTSSSGYAQFPQVALSANGTRATAIWYRSPGGPYVVQTASAAISGNAADWSGVTTLSTAGYNAYDQEIGVSADGTKATAVWRLDTGTYTFKVQSASATVSGKTASWSGATDLSSIGAGAPHMALSASGTTAIAIWQVGSVLKSAAATISGASASWSPGVDVFEGYLQGPQVALSADGTHATVVGEVPGSNGPVSVVDAAVSGSTATWSTPVAVSATDGNPTAPQVAVSADGSTTVVVWSRSNGSNSIIQAATRAAPPRCTVAPTSPQVSAGPDGAALSFTAVPSGCEADRFQVRCMPLGVPFTTGANDEVRYVYTATLPVVVGALKSGKTYHCMVREQVTGDRPYEGPLSVWSNDIAIAYTTPAAPTSVSAAREASQTVRVSFAPPSNGGATISDYDVQYSTSPTFASGVTFSESGTTTDAWVDVSGLTNGTTYYFRVRATNLAGNGPWSSISNGARPYTTPGTPTRVSAARLPGGGTQRTVRVSFTAPGNGGSPITDYDVQYSLDPTFASGVVFSEGGTTTGSSVDVTGLVNGTTYYFQVRASNLAGDGPWSATSNGVKP